MFIKWKEDSVVDVNKLSLKTNFIHLKNGLVKNVAGNTAENIKPEINKKLVNIITNIKENTVKR